MSNVNNELTTREKQVLTELANGLTSKKAGEKLGISHKTVEAHKENIYKKTRLRNIAQLTKLAINLGLTTTDIVLA